MTKPGDLFTHHNQPYGTEVLLVLSIRPRTFLAWEFDCDLGRSVRRERVTHDIEGRVVDGSQTSRILAVTSTRKTAGELRWVYGVSDRELERGEKTSVAC